MPAGSSTAAANDGMGVPIRPVASRVALSLVLAPPRNVQDLVRVAGRMGFPQSSLSAGAEGPSPRPPLPWHLLHSIASNISLPRAMDSLEETTSFGRSATLGGSLNLSGAKILWEETRVHRSLSGMPVLAGIDVPGIPSVMTLNRSWSVGGFPEGVVRILYRPLVKSRGLGSNWPAAGPSPLPSMPS